MRVLIIGADEVWAIEKIYLKYLAEQGVEVNLFAAQSIFYTYYNRSLLHKILFKTGLSGIERRICRAAKQKIEVYRPAVIWVFKGMEVSPGLLQWARQKGIKLANYNPDNPFIFTGKGSGNSNVTKGIPLYDLHFTYNLSIEATIRSRFNIATVFLPFGFDVSDALFNVCAAEPEIGKACFLGNPDSKRAQFLAALAECGVMIDVYGNDWNKFPVHKNIRVFKPVYGDAFWKILRKYRVQINLMRVHNEDSHNMRSFEIPGIGGIMVAPDTREHRMFFEHEKEVFLFSDTAHCATIIQRVLMFSPAEASLIRTNARSRSVNAGYSYRDRAAFVKKTLLQLQQPGDHAIK